MAELEITQQITMSFLHDGRVGLELRERHDRSHELRVATVSHVKATSTILRELAMQPPKTSVPRHEVYRGFPEGSRCYRVTLGARPDDGLRRFSPRAESLCRSFRAAFAREDTDDRPDAAARFADDLAREMEAFLHRCRHRVAARLVGGLYPAVLEALLEESRAVRAAEHQGDFHLFQAGTGAILADEEYLVLSDDERVRDLYAALRAEQSSRYDWSMDLAKGGNARPR